MGARTSGEYLKGLVVLRTDFHGRRILAFPDLGCETSPADPSFDGGQGAAAAE